MDVAAFDFTLPDTHIATRPVTPREAARLLVVGDALADHVIGDLPQFVQAGDVLVFNDTRVMPARLFGQRGVGRVEILLHKMHGEYWHCFARPAKKLHLGDQIKFSEDMYATVEDRLESGEVVLRFNISGAAFYEALARIGQMPLPPYIARMRPTDAQDATDYQTIYAREQGSVAAPTAGLHFTPQLMAALHARGVQCVYVTLHVGAGTFQPVKVENTNDHVMHAETAFISADVAAAINAARAAGGRVIAVGTTSLRTLESAADEKGIMHPFNGDTRIFITPGYQFRAVDMLFTNFHLPRSTLFMLVSAFCGLNRMQAAYKHAISIGYRFYSYGDACLLYKAA